MTPRTLSLLALFLNGAAAGMASAAFALNILAGNTGCAAIAFVLIAVSMATAFVLADWIRHSLEIRRA